MFVTILTSIYLALAVFVVVRFINKKRQQIAEWTARKDFKDSLLYQIVSTKREKDALETEISKIYFD